jgi:hypothetical protein
VLPLAKHPDEKRPKRPVLLAVDQKQSPKKWRCPISNSTRVTSPFVTVTCAIKWKVSRNSNSPEGEKKSPASVCALVKTEVPCPTALNEKGSTDSMSVYDPSLQSMRAVSVNVPRSESPGESRRSGS